MGPPWGPMGPDCDVGMREARFTLPQRPLSRPQRPVAREAVGRPKTGFSENAGNRFPRLPQAWGTLGTPGGMRFRSIFDDIPARTYSSEFAI